MSYVDAHVHFWDDERCRYDWLAQAAALPRSVTLDDYREATADDPPVGFVFVQADADPADGADEARWVDEMCGDEADFRGMVVWAPVDEGTDAVGRHLETLALDSVVGVRRLIQGEPLGFANDRSFAAGVAEVGRHDLVFDICIVPHQLAEAAELAALADSTRLVLDHLGKPDIANGEIDEWRKGLERLAEFDHVSCKLSGLVTEADHHAWTTADLAPYFDIALEAFGPDRLIWVATGPW